MDEPEQIPPTEPEREPLERPLAPGAELPGVAALAGPVSWAMLIAGLPAIAGAFALAFASDLTAGSASVVLDIASVAVLQLAWIGPAFLARLTLRRALPQLGRPAFRFGVLAPGFFVAFLLALPLTLVPLISLPLLVFGPVPVVALSIRRLVRAEEALRRGGEG